MTTSAELMRDCDPGMQPSAEQWVQFADKRVRMLAVLHRTCVLELEGQRVLVRLDQVEVGDPGRLLWQAKPGDSKQQTIFAANRRAQLRKQIRGAELE